MAFGVAAAFVVGVLLGGLGWNIALAAGIGAVALGIFRTVRNIFRWPEIAFFLAAFCCGAFYYHLYLGWDSATLTLPYGRQLSVSALVVDEPKESARYEIFDVAPQRSHALTVLAPPASGYRYGDLLQLKGMLDPPDHPARTRLWRRLS